MGAPVQTLEATLDLQSMTVTATRTHPLLDLQVSTLYKYGQLVGQQLTKLLHGFLVLALLRRLQNAAKQLHDVLYKHALYVSRKCCYLGF